MKKRKTVPTGNHRFPESPARSQIHFTLASYRDDTVMVQVTVPGERWEVEFFTDGHVEVEKFRSSGELFDVSALETLFTQFGE